MSKKKGRSEENTLKTQADAAYQRSLTPAPQTQLLNDIATKRYGFLSGQGGAPIDVRSADAGLGAGLALRTEALRARDEGRIGRGYGSLSGGANPNFIAGLDRENQLERQLRASGQLEGLVTDTLNNDQELLYGLGRNEDERNSRNAESAYARLTDYRRNKKPGFFKQLALGALGGLSFTKGGFSA